MKRLVWFRRVLEAQALDSADGSPARYLRYGTMERRRRDRIRRTHQGGRLSLAGFGASGEERMGEVCVFSQACACVRVWRWRDPTPDELQQGIG